MLSLRSSVIHFALLIMFNSPAFAAIDDFSAGHYNIPSAGLPSVIEIQNCLSFCQGGSREVHLLAAGLVPASSRLLAPPGEAETFLADGAVSFIYGPGSGNIIDFVSGGSATQFEIWFTAFEPGAEVGVFILDDFNASDSQVMLPSFATPPTPSQPGIVVFPFASFATVDLTRVKRIDFTISTFDETGGIYSVTLIVAPGANAGTLTTSGELDTAGPPYPSVPKIDFEWEEIPPIGPPVGIMIGLEDVQDESGLQVGASVQATPGDTASFLATTLASPVTSPTIQYRFDFESLETMSPTSINIMPVNWSAGQDYAEVIAHLGVDGGMWQWRLFMETSQPLSLSDVTAVPGSALVTVTLSGDVDTGTPVLDMAMAGSFVSAPLVPSLDHPLALAMLSIALMATGIWLHRSRRVIFSE